MLKIHDGKPLPQWPLDITINSMLAILLVIFKISLTVPLSQSISQLKWQAFRERPQRLIDMEEYDYASRSAWGAFLFSLKVETDTIKGRVLRHNPRSWILLLQAFKPKQENITKYLAKSASFLVVIAFIADPFAQQVVIYPSCTITSTTLHSTISRTNIYSAAGPNEHNGYSNGDPSMAVAIDTGSFSPPSNVSTLVATDCQSGNCTFDIFSTVALCSSCEDLTDMIIVSNDSSTGIESYTHSGTQEYTLANGPNVTWGDTVFETFAVEDTDDPLDPASNIFHFIAFGFNWLMDNPVAVGCAVRPCQRVYKSTMVNNILGEELLSSIPIGVRAIDPWYILASNSTYRNGTLQHCEPSSSYQPGLVQVPKRNVDASPSDYVSDDNQTIWYPQDCTWSIGGYATININKQLTTALAGLSLIDVGDGAFSINSSDYVTASNMWRNGTMTLSSISDFMKNLTDVMTTTIRKTGEDGPSAYTQGTIEFQSTCVKVQWKWFSILIILTALVLVLFSAFLLQSPDDNSTDGSETWKSSSLAVLSCRLDESLERDMRGPMNIARDTMARLGEDEDGRPRFYGGRGQIGQ
ncbi:hypothetical protein N431DRAFT_559346 [Stipitochalara longipes BDJ]|nr:hypothetical protein N431DRAFT_559346 [Stipitochalara longipes BDJ]